MPTAPSASPAAPGEKRAERSVGLFPSVVATSSKTHRLFTPAEDRQLAPAYVRTGLPRSDNSSARRADALGPASRPRANVSSQTSASSERVERIDLHRVFERPGAP